ncbi:MAG: hypothetical protein IJZ23_01480 [Roseburia sp.]|nr:hypothetical protein [Roseburia sp.]
MGIFGQSAEKKREKEIRQEAKDLVKELIAAGMDKNTAKNYMLVLENMMVAACAQRDVYIESKRKMALGQVIMNELLADIVQMEPVRVRERLTELAETLMDIYHECTIRMDDMDFISTHTYINKAAKTYDGTERLMLQSELENLLHMVSEIIEWEEPDFCALALFCKYGNRMDLADIENGQRNEMLMRYYRGQYWDDFERELASVGMEMRVKNWIEKKVKQEEN